jgi:hypothetical protein
MSSKKSFCSPIALVLPPMHAAVRLPRSVAVG